MQELRKNLAVQLLITKVDLILSFKSLLDEYTHSGYYHPVTLSISASLIKYSASSIANIPSSGIIHAVNSSYSTVH